MIRSVNPYIQRLTRIFPRILRYRLLCSSGTTSIYISGSHGLLTPINTDCHSSLEFRSLLIAAGGILASTIAINSMAYCEEPVEEMKPKDGEANEEDPYANLPEEDEETDCTICKTFRQGPCRPSWRKLERCFKDNEGSEAAASACTQYFMSHQECLSGFTNLYQLISLELKQELIDDTEKAVVDTERLCWSRSASDGFIDWSRWRSFCKDMGKPFVHSLAVAGAQANGPGAARAPLWKRVPENTEPLLVATEAKLPTEQDGMLLKFAYALDQNGLTLGVAYHDYYGKIIEEHKAAADAAAKQQTEEKDDSSESSSVSGDTPTLEPEISLEFYILPKDTKSVQLCAFYTEDPTKSDDSKKLLDVRLLKTTTYQLKDQC